MRSPRRALPFAILVLLVCGLLTAGVGSAVGTHSRTPVSGTVQFPVAEWTSPHPHLAGSTSGQRSMAGSASGPAAVRPLLTGSTSPPADPVAPGQLVIEIRLQRNGNARFVVSAGFAVDNETDRAAFRELASDFEAGTANLELGASTFERASELASNATGREMRIVGIERSGVVENETGVLRLSFTWTNFANVTDGTYRIGDAFNTTHGTWLSGLSANQTLVVRTPPGYGIIAAPTGGPNGAQLANGDLIWEGPVDFEPGFLRATFQPGPPPTTSTPSDDLSAAIVGVSLVGLGVLVFGAYWLSTRRGPESGAPDGVAGTAESGSGADATSRETTGEAESPGSGGTAGPEGVGEPDGTTGADEPAATEGAAGAAGAPGPAEGAEGAEASGPAEGAEGAGPAEGAEGAEGAEAAEGAGPAGATAAEGATADDEQPDVELLSDEERVEHLIQQNGGRMKQATIVTETGWSNAKVSQLLSSMADEDRIQKLRIGRENLIALPEEDIGDFDDE